MKSKLTMLNPQCAMPPGRIWKDNRMGNIHRFYFRTRSENRNFENSKPRVHHSSSLKHEDEEINLGFHEIRMTLSQAEYLFESVTAFRIYFHEVLVFINFRGRISFHFWTTVVNYYFDKASCGIISTESC